MNLPVMMTALLAATTATAPPGATTATSSATSPVYPGASTQAVAPGASTVVRGDGATVLLPVASNADADDSLSIRAGARLGMPLGARLGARLGGQAESAPSLDTQDPRDRYEDRAQQYDSYGR